MLVFLLLLAGVFCLGLFAVGASMPRVNFLGLGLVLVFIPALIGAWPQ